ncbi:MAG: hypothetical protein RLZZ597_2764 [Cyanobacteriota bacterium]|jgi:outer membrane protein TolC
MLKHWSTQPNPLFVCLGFPFRFPLLWPVVCMRDLCRRRLILSGLGAAALAWPSSPAAAQARPWGDGAGQGLAHVVLSRGDALPSPLDAAGAAAQADTAEDAQTPASSPPTTTDDASVSSPAPEAASTPSEAGAPGPSAPLEPGPSAPSASEGAETETLPLQGDQPGEDAPAEATSPSATPSAIPGEAAGRPIDPTAVDPALDYLNPHPNPLRLQTRPDEVEIIGTQPISLEEAIELAHRNNEELRIAQRQLERSREGLRAEQALLYPTVDLSSGLQTSNQTTFGQSDETLTSLTGRVRTDYNLGLSGERAARIQAAEEQVRLAELALERTREQLRLDTTTDYYAVQEASEQIRINQAFLEEAEDNLRITRLREEVGVGTRFDVLRAEVQVANARQNIIQARSQRDIAQRQLSRRLNIPPSITVTTLGVEVIGTWPLTLEESIVLAYQNRAELEQFLTERDLNEAQQRVALAGGRPNLGVFAQYDIQSLLDAPVGATRSTDSGFAVGAQLTWRLFDGGASRARSAQSELDIRIDEIEFENARNLIRTQVEEAYYTLQANQANIATATIAVNQAQQALRLANLRFEAGVGTQTEVLNATSDLTQAEGNLVRAKLDYNRALARLERAVSNLSPLPR